VPYFQLLACEYTRPLGCIASRGPFSVTRVLSAASAVLLVEQSIELQIMKKLLSVVGFHYLVSGWALASKDKLCVTMTLEEGRETGRQRDGETERQREGGRRSDGEMERRRERGREREREREGLSLYVILANIEDFRSTGPVLAFIKIGS
jgi:hypothetical protein